MSSNRFCGEIVQPFVDVANYRQDLAQFQIIGGNGSAALKDPATEIDLDAGIIVASNKVNLPRLRDDGTLRDMDVLVLSTNPEEVEAVRELAEGVVADELEVSVFGLKSSVQLADQMSSPVKSSAKVFLSDRYINDHIDTKHGDFVYGNKAIYPFRGRVPEDFMTTSVLVTEGVDGDIPTSHPGATILNYLTRSISGLRPKDEVKVQDIADNLLGRYPELKEWIIDGPGKGTFEFARILLTLRESKRNPSVLEVGRHLHVEPYNYDDLVDLDTFIAPNLSPAGQKAVVAVAHAKSRVLHVAESQQKIVTWFQTHMEQRIPGTVHND